ncbi:hypothetical protein AMEX_G5349 [Astyanax mexicanus]|uniref:Uncharacterized protein n=1 Tax=Astyanax mexicanus TaxID=7994 RepID=A0A8T2ME33_ASTMX|nr:hypothetical protein AMEX_G5349 [Astyanax mexicanus]
MSEYTYSRTNRANSTIGSRLSSLSLRSGWATKCFFFFQLKCWPKNVPFGASLVYTASFPQGYALSATHSVSLHARKSRSSWESTSTLQKKQKRRQVEITRCFFMDCVKSTSISNTLSSKPPVGSSAV